MNQDFTVKKKQYLSEKKFVQRSSPGKKIPAQAVSEEKNSCKLKIPHPMVFSNILEGKNAFLGYKNKKFKKSENWHFSKGVNPWFWFKNDHFFNFFLANIGQDNVFHDILERKDTFLGYKNKKMKKSKNWHFFKGVNPWFWSKNDHFYKFFFLGNIVEESVFY